MESGISHKNCTIQGLRGAACIIVFFSHAFGIIPEDIKRGIWFQWSALHFFNDGKVAVCVFWVLSGYYITKSSMNLSIKKYYEYIKRKFWRLYPTYFLSLIIGMLFCNLSLEYDKNVFSVWFANFWNNKVDMVSFIKQILLQGNFDVINPPAWTMKYEINMAVFLPFIITIVLAVFHSKKVINIFLLLISFGIVMMGERGYGFPIIHITVFPEFCLGMLICINEEWFKKYIIEREKILLPVGIFLMDINNIFHLEINSFLIEYIMCIGSTMLIIICLYGNLLNKILGYSWLVSIGEISYEIYLFHFIMFLAMRGIMGYINNWIINISIVFILTLLVGYIVHKMMKGKLGRIKFG